MFILIKKNFLLICLCILALINPTIIKGQTTLFSDDFNDNDISDWTVVRNSQNSNQNLPCMNEYQPTNWSVEDGKLFMNIFRSPPCKTEIIPNNFNLSETNSYSYEFDITLIETSATDRNALFIWQDVNNWYGIKLEYNKVLIQKVIDGRSRSIPNSWGYYSFQANNTYRFKIKVENDNFKIYVNNFLVVNTDDTGLKISGYKTVGLQASVGSAWTSKVQFDNVLVSLLDEEQTTDLPIEQIKQTDIRWGDFEYDSASIWSPSKAKIKDWGCALTSIVMILKYHGIHTLVDGTNINPATLNTWLRSQTDGYIHGGLINWFAISRLTKQISDHAGTPKLEYTRLNGSAFDTAFSEIQNNKPVILELAGHFVTGKGRVENDISINDPYYEYNLFSEHNKLLLSTRLFQPSQTDLSGIVISTSSNATMQLFKDGQPVTEASYTTDYLSAPLDTIDSPKSTILEYSKPPNGIYIVEIKTATAFESFSLYLHTYSVSGDVSSRVVTLISDADKSSYLNFEYNNVQPTVITNYSSFENLKSSLDLLFSLNQIHKKFLVVGLKTYLDQAPQSILDDQIRWTFFLEDIVSKYQSLYSVNGFLYIMQELQNIRNNLEAE